MRSGSYDYFFDVADSEEEQNTQRFQVERLAEGIHEETKRIYGRVMEACA